MHLINTQESLCTLKDNKKISKELKEISKEKNYEMKWRIYIPHPWLPEHFKGQLAYSFSPAGNRTIYSQAAAPRTFGAVTQPIGLEDAAGRHGPGVATSPPGRHSTPRHGEGNAGCPMYTTPPGQNTGVGAMPPAPSCAACILLRTGSPFIAAGDSTTPAVCSPGGAVFMVGVWAEQAGWMYKVARLKSWGLLHSFVYPNKNLLKNGLPRV